MFEQDKGHRKQQFYLIYLSGLDILYIACGAMLIWGIMEINWILYHIGDTKVEESNIEWVK